MTTIEDVMGRALAYAMDDTGERGTREKLLAAVKQYAAERVAESTAHHSQNHPRSQARLSDGTEPAHKTVTEIRLRNTSVRLCDECLKVLKWQL